MVHVKGWFWRICPRSGLRSGGTCERTLVPVFVPGELPSVPSLRFSFRENIRQNHPFGKPPCCQPSKGFFLRRGPAMGFAVQKGSEKGEGVLRRGYSRGCLEP